MLMGKCGVLYTFVGAICSSLYLLIYTFILGLYFKAFLARAPACAFLYFGPSICWRGFATQLARRAILYLLLYFIL
ncbi:hypothetical protein [Pontibacter mucosus]|uniref:hypothetical protein n=1 Tax=Pontibacter mucosus TaxID=1649266 RepID=UPI0011B23707|nr:hypothetical protein [Pontibacter mucosus]